MKTARIHPLHTFLSYPLESVRSATPIVTDPSSSDQKLMASSDFDFEDLECRVEFEVVIEVRTLFGGHQLRALEVGEATYNRAKAYLESQNSRVP